MLGSFLGRLGFFIFDIGYWMELIGHMFLDHCQWTKTDCSVVGTTFPSFCISKCDWMEGPAGLISMTGGGCPHGWPV